MIPLPPVRRDSPKFRRLIEVSNNSRLLTYNEVATIPEWLTSTPLPSWIKYDPLVVELLDCQQIPVPERDGFWQGMFADEGRLAANNASTFLTLPLELRDMIYEYAMKELPKDCLVEEQPSRMKSIPPFLNKLPSIAFANQQTLTESALVYIRRSRFILNRGYTSHWQLLIWLSQFPYSQGFTAIRELNYKREGPYRDVPALLLFRGLRRISIGIALNDVMQGSGPLQVNKIGERMQLGPLFELHALKEIVFEGRMNSSTLMVFSDPLEHQKQYNAYLRFFAIVTLHLRTRGRYAKLRVNMTQTFSYRKDMFHFHAIANHLPDFQASHEWNPESRSGKGLEWTEEKIPNGTIYRTKTEPGPYVRWYEYSGVRAIIDKCLPQS
jgi:hypothetical protein